MYAGHVLHREELRRRQGRIRLQRQVQKIFAACCIRLGQGGLFLSSLGGWKGRVTCRLPQLSSYFIGAAAATR